MLWECLCVKLYIHGYVHVVFTPIATYWIIVPIIYVEWHMRFFLVYAGNFFPLHYSDVKMSEMASQTTGVSMVCSAVCSGRSKDTSMLRVTGFFRGIHQLPLNSPHKGPVTRKMFTFDDVIMALDYWCWNVIVIFWFLSHMIIFLWCWSICFCLVVS